MDSIDRGVGQLVDADMNKESTRLQALQVQQQLGIQALSIANGNSQSILSLFKQLSRSRLIPDCSRWAAPSSAALRLRLHFRTSFAL